MVLLIKRGVTNRDGVEQVEMLGVDSSFSALDRFVPVVHFEVPRSRDAAIKVSLWSPTHYSESIF